MKTMAGATSALDAVISEVRRHKQDIASEHGFDVVALGRALQAREAADPRFQKQGGQGGEAVASEVSSSGR